VTSDAPDSAASAPSAAEPSSGRGPLRIEPRDLVSGALIAVLLALSPLTPNEWGISFAIGAAMGAVWVAYRSYARRSSVSAATAPQSLSVELTWFGAACLAAWAIAFAPTWVWMYREWTGSVWQNNHGIFIPVIMVLLARSALRRDRGGPEEASAWGLPIVALGLALALVDSASSTRYLAAIGLVITLPGLSLLLLGRRRTRMLGPVWLISIFMLPLPTTAFHQVALRNWTAAAATPLIQSIGLSALREQTVITLPNSMFIVGDACSGFATLYSSIAVAVFMACFCRSPWRRVMLLALAAPLALAANVLRAFVLVLLGALGDVSLLDTALHEASGVAAFFLVLVVLYRFSDQQRLQEAFA
jgi:exosortase